MQIFKTAKQLCARISDSINSKPMPLHRCSSLFRLLFLRSSARGLCRTGLPNSGKRKKGRDIYRSKGREKDKSIQVHNLSINFASEFDRKGVFPSQKSGKRKRKASAAAENGREREREREVGKREWKGLSQFHCAPSREREREREGEGGDASKFVSQLEILQPSPHGSAVRRLFFLGNGGVWQKIYGDDAAGGEIAEMEEEGEEGPQTSCK